MQDDTFPAAEKILVDIENVLKKNLSLKGFEIVPAKDNENKSPVFHHEDALGLASWCVRPLYCYVYRRLMELRQNRHRREEPSTVARWLMGALLLNPDVTTFWNMRCELVRCQKLEPINELAFSRMVLSNNPKCFEAFAYRRWLLPYILDAKGTDYDPTDAESLLCAEVKMAEACADWYANNYHAWTHRRLVMNIRHSRGYTHPTLDSEIKVTSAWCQRHVSDHSGFVYRQFLLKQCMAECSHVPANFEDYNERRDLLVSYIASDAEDSTDESRNPVDPIPCAVLPENEKRACYRALSYWVEECRANEDAIRMYADHEALWCHRRFLAYILVKYLANCRKRGSDQSKIRFWDYDEEEVLNDMVVDVTCPLEDAFCSRSRELVELARNRSDHEKLLADRFTKYIGSFGLQLLPRRTSR
ncbi:protein prenyltransferase alpha subunit repeat-containing protein 1-like [Prorops nasuta]|uniref:protein prenyltransferase alpha subunit repeat-containing protein 1-like n=1 Tax=Prorops nasuta TaxID=863751 RepID=UPI0034CE8A75